MTRFLWKYLPAILPFLLLSPLKVYTQSPFHQWGIEVSEGVSVGWWIYDKGFADTLPDWHQGYDRTHLSAMFQTDLTFDYRSKKFFASVGGRFSSLQDNIMISSADRRRTGTRYRITTGNAVHFFSLFLTGGYNLSTKNTFSFTPTLSVGTFFLNTTHPQKSFFQYRYFYDIGVRHTFHLSENWDFSIFPHYSQMVITTTPAADSGSGHHIYTLGVNLAFRRWIM